MPSLLKFVPLIKRIRWGGQRLGSILGKPIGDAQDAAESWELVDHGTDQSVVESGEWRGRTLADMVREHPQALFGRESRQTQFPLLVKFLDANDRLSLQVHPNDAQAKSYNPIENGKTEAWVILSATPGAKLYAGLKSGVDAGTLEHRLADGDLESCLHTIDVKAGDCVFIPAGTVHAIGEGVLLAEIQQSSDITFRLHDWGRLGADGKPRAVHVRESLDCTDFSRGPVEPVVPQSLPAATFDSPAPPNRHEELVRCPYFVIRRHTAELPFSIPNDDRFHVLMGLSGTAEVIAGNERQELPLGQTVLALAEREPVKIIPRGSVVVLDSFVP